MSELEPRIEAVRQQYGLSQDDFWQIKQNKQWVCKHAALEIVAVKAKIEWLSPIIIEHEADRLLTSMVVTGKMGDRTEWATGETNPTNYSVTGRQPAYPWAMSEKRAKDRVVLKLVGIHGLVYSEDEMPARNDDGEAAIDRNNQRPVQSAQPAATALPIPAKSGLKDTAQRALWGRLVAATRAVTTLAEFNALWAHPASQAAYDGFSRDWKDELDTEKRDKEAELRERAPAGDPTVTLDAQFPGDTPLPKATRVAMTP